VLKFKRKFRHQRVKEYDFECSYFIRQFLHFIYDMINARCLVETNLDRSFRIISQEICNFPDFPYNILILK